MVRFIVMTMVTNIFSSCLLLHVAELLYVINNDYCCSQAWFYQNNFPLAVVVLVGGFWVVQKAGSKLAERDLLVPKAHLRYFINETLWCINILKRLFQKISEKECADFTQKKLKFKSGLGGLRGCGGLFWQSRTTMQMSLFKFSINNS